jgi:queuine tRNA-ribosyltransferase
MFTLLKQSKKSQARLGRIVTAHGTVKTPFFMPIATKAAVKTLSAADVDHLGSEIILSNTYHLYLQPGLEILKKAGGLHKFMNWDKPILTDSGGFQVFSLSKIRRIVDGGVEFQSHLDGSRHLLTPKKVLEIQKIIGSDIAMILDICPSSVAPHTEISEAVTITTEWAKLAKKHRITLAKHQKMFAIVQGGLHQDLRLRSVDELVALDFDGYAIGGLAVGEGAEEMYQVLSYTAPALPKNKPRYLMGVGMPDNIVQAVRYGVDMFDCVIPSREARHGRLYLWKGKGDVTKSKFYETINITSAKYKKDFSTIETKLGTYSKAYLYHLFKTAEPLGQRLATSINIEFYLELMKRIRGAIKESKL